MILGKKELRALITLAGKVDPSLQAAMLKASGESARAANKVKGHWGSLGQSVKNGAIGFAKGAATMFVATAAAAAVAFGAMAMQGLSYASDLTEVQNVVDKTFTQSAAVIDKFAETALESYGITTLQAKQYSSTMGAMLKSMGLTSDETLTMAQNMTALSGDMASFYNLSADDAFAKIRAGISGETEPLKQLGINMSVANLQAFAMSQGMDKTYDSMTQSEQAMLRYNYLMQTTADAQGDFSDTSGTFANQQKLLKANLQQTSGEIMSSMMPALAGGMQELNNFIGSMDTASVGSFVGQIAEMAVSFMPLVMQLLPMFGNLLMSLAPMLLELGQMLIPVVVQVVQTLMEAFAPLMPIFMDLVSVLLPPFAALLEAVMPIISTLASILLSVLVPAFAAVSAIITPVFDVLSKIAGVISKVAGKVGAFFTGNAVEGMNASLAADGMTGYANGGFASRPSIFGEAGLEAAIPIKRGSPRSVSLLYQTAQMLGVSSRFAARAAVPSIAEIPIPAREKTSALFGRLQGLMGDGMRLFGRGKGDLEQVDGNPPPDGAPRLQRIMQTINGGNRHMENKDKISFTFAPQIMMGDPDATITSALQEAARQMREMFGAMLDKYFNNRERLAWE